MDYQLLIAVVLGVGLLLTLILKIKLHAFLSLLIAAIAVGVLAGMDATVLMKSVQNGMGGTLGFVATVVGLGAMFGAILEQSGGAKVVADYLIRKFGIRNAPLAMTVTGFIIAIPVFFDVAFILLVPLLYALQKRTGKSLVLFAIPLLAGLTVTHNFIPPTPGPIAVADIIGADLGWVILVGAAVGIPTALVSGLLFGKYIGNKIVVGVPFDQEVENVVPENIPKASEVLLIIAIPIVLILINTFVTSGLIPFSNSILSDATAILGHPFTALILANLIAWYVLGIKRNFTRKNLLEISGKSLAPAGAIILITGAGGVFKQVLIDSGAGKMIAGTLSDAGFPILLFAFLVAAIVRIIQGSSTVSAITAAGLVAPLISLNTMSQLDLASIVVAIACGAAIMSHVNDSGFWMVNQFLGLTEKQTFRSWTVMTIILSLTGFILVSILNYLF